MSETTLPAAMNGEPPDGTVVIGFMCRIDWECEIGAASGGNRIYPSEQNLRAHRPCVDGCGIVEVEVRCRRVVVEGTENA